MKNMERKEVFISVDIETNGPIPGEYSMLSLGAVALQEDSPNLIDTFYVNIECIPGAKEYEETMEWWNKETNKVAFNKTRIDMKTPELAMKLFHRWVRDISNKVKGDPIFISYPAGFDFTFVYWYLIKYVGNSPFSFSALDIKTYASAILKKPYRKSTKRNMPNRWHNASYPHTHNALDDAMEQGFLFLEMLKENRDDKRTALPKT